MDLSPEWQRNVVWTQCQKESLIDSIVKDFPISYVTVWILPGHAYVCVDGKNRLSTLVEYVGGSFGDFASRTNGERESFLNRGIQYCELFGDTWTTPVIEEFFTKIQGGKHLTIDERLNARNDLSLVRLVKRLWKDPGVRECIEHASGVQRMEHIHILASVVGLSPDVQAVSRLYPGQDQTAGSGEKIIRYFETCYDAALDQVSFPAVRSFVHEVVDLVRAVHDDTGGWAWSLKGAARRSTSATSRSYTLVGLIHKYTPDSDRPRIRGTFRALATKLRNAAGTSAQFSTDEDVFFTCDNEKGQYTIAIAKQRFEAFARCLRAVQ